VLCFVVRCDGEGERWVHTHKVCCSLPFLVDRGRFDALVLWMLSFFFTPVICFAMDVWSHRIDARRVRFEL
jgi:hypothetical protein